MGISAVVELKVDQLKLKRSSIAWHFSITSLSLNYALHVQLSLAGVFRKCWDDVLLAFF